MAEKCYFYKQNDSGVEVNGLLGDSIDLNCSLNLKMSMIVKLGLSKTKDILLDLRAKT